MEAPPVRYGSSENQNIFRFYIALNPFKTVKNIIWFRGANS